MAPPMSSMLARAASSASAACRASRAAALASARAARSAAAARRAAVAVSRAARSSTDASSAAAAAAEDPALGNSSREARSFRCDAASCGAAPSRLPLGSDSTHSDSCLSPDDEPHAPEFVADEKDLESDEALWSLYERWCKHFNQERDPDEMARRFGEFKRTVLFVHQENNSDRPYKLAINQFTDGKLAEVCLLDTNSAFHREELAKLSKLPKTGSRFVWLDG